MPIDEAFLTDQQILYIGGIIALVALLVLLKLVRGTFRALRRLRPTKIHPKLQKYADADARQIAERRRQAAKILTTSSRAEIAGYKVVRQVEAVYVDGFREPADAIEGLKAAAAAKGANAVINLQHQRTAGGRCAASGDAVLVKSIASDGS